MMERALEAAKWAGLAGEVPVGAVLAGADGAVLAVCGNEVEARQDPTAHAEMLALRAAARRIGNTRLAGCDLYVTLEPCPMCAAAAGLFRVRRIIFGAYDPKGGGVEHGPRIFVTAGALHKPEWIGGVQETASADLLRGFFAALR